MALRKTPPVETMTVTETRQNLSETLNRVRRGESRVLVEKSGIPVGAILSPEDFEAFQKYEQRRAEQWAAVDRLRESFADVPEDELDAELEKAIREVKEERRQERLAPYERQR